jgi:hypothetical protein
MMATSQTFRAGDEVVLVRGSYPGTLGKFLRVKEDAKWADIEEANGVVRSHPMIWLDHVTAANPVPVE